MQPDRAFPFFGTASIFFAVINDFVPLKCVLFVVGVILLGIFLLRLCPRCRLNVNVSGDVPSWKPISSTCIRCGRNRKGVWPLQFVFKPEPWDGVRKDKPSE
ncbi:hypothetical protein [Asticcacaulis sp. YBE204]|uniref:hypothetical protein n=1 Tax=Asticcacaulis sp. YBE204 TaxID=1282363 RepID=UPI0012DD9FF5|nr:hypothetical protein [Asticcacaulis sp. YBE204]